MANGIPSILSFPHPLPASGLLSCLHNFFITGIKKHLATFAKITFICTGNRIIVPVPFLNRLHPVFIQVSKPVFIQSIKITGKNTSVRFYHILQPAVPPLAACLRPISHGKRNIVFKLPDKRLLSLLHIFIPEPEKPDQKFPISFRRQSIPSFPMHFSQRIETGDVLLVLPPLLR